MKKYIWAKDTPFAKKGDELQIISQYPITSDTAYVFGIIREFGDSLQLDNSKTTSIKALIDTGWIEEVSTRWKPDNQEDYYYVNDYVRVVKTCWNNFYCDENRFQSNNLFKTREEAEAAAEKVKALLLSLHE